MRGNNIIGQKFGNLLVIDYLGIKNKGNYWLCKCVCGNTKGMMGYNLTDGTYKDCGCVWNNKLKRGIRLGAKLSQETKNKLSESHKGLKRSEQAIKNMIIASKGRNLGRVQSEETRKKMSEARKGKSATWMVGKVPWNKGTKGIMVPWNKGLLGYKAGKENSMWRGGIYKTPYTVDWTSTLKRSIGERDYYICQICGAEQGDHSFPIHHIDYNKKNCNPNNLITLCKSCHSKTNSKREYWETLLAEHLRKNDMNNNILSEQGTSGNNKEELG